LGYVYSKYLVAEAGLSLLFQALAVFLIFSTLQLFFTKEIGRRFLILILQTTAFLFFFYTYDLRILAISAGVMIVLPLFGEMLGRRELGNALEIKFFKTAKPLLAKWTTALIIVLILLYLPQWDQDSIFISKDNFRGFYSWAAGVASTFYPRVDFNSTFGELAEGLSETQLRGDPTFRNLPPRAQSELLERTSLQVSGSLSRSLGIQILPDEPVSDVFYDFIVKLLRGWREQFGNFFLAAWGLSIFFVLRGFGTIFYWAISFVSFLIYQILFSSGFVHIIGETRTHEVIEY
ncbi:MAG: hypothetical protein ACE5HI_16720, partial [bacterium]